MSLSTEEQSARAEYRRRIQQRQTVIFGSISAVMAILLLLGTLFFSGVLPFPFNKEFSRPEAEQVLVPCPVQDAPPAAYKDITVRIYNANGTQGLASSVSNTLTKAGVTVSEATNWAGSEVNDPVRIYTGKEGITSAYTLRAFYPDAAIVFDSSNNTAVVEIVLGKNYEKIVPKPTKANRQAAMKPLDQCEDAQ